MLPRYVAFIERHPLWFAGAHAVGAGVLLVAAAALSGSVAAWVLVLAGVVFAGAPTGLALGFRRQLLDLGRRQNEAIGEARELAKDAAAAAHAAVLLAQRHPGLEMPVSSYSMNPSNLLALLDHVRRTRPRRVLELGSGISTLYLAAELAKLGEMGEGNTDEEGGGGGGEGWGGVLSLDQGREWAELCNAALERHGLAERARVLHAPLRPTPIDGGASVAWYDLEAAGEAIAALGPIDLLVIDGPLASDDLCRAPALPALAERLAPGAWIYLDDANRDREGRVLEMWRRRFPGLEPARYSTLTGWALMRLPSTR